MGWLRVRPSKGERQGRVRSRVLVVSVVISLLVPVAMELMATAAGAAAGDIDTAAGTGTPGYNGDGESALLAQLNGPAGVSTDSQGNTLVGDAANSRIRIIAESATNPGYPLAGCTGTCTWTPGAIYTVAGDGTAAYSGDGGSATAAEINQAEGVAVDPGGNIVIADIGNRRVRVVAVSAANPGYVLAGCGGTCTWTVGDIFTIAGDGTSTYVSDGVAATSTALIPSDVTVDTSGNPLVPDGTSGRLRIIAVSASNPGYPLAGCAGTCTWTVGDVFTVAGDGTTAYVSDGVAATSTGMAAVYVALDAGGDLVISDLNNARVRVVAVAPSNPGYVLAGCGGACTWTVGDIFTIAGNGTVGYSGDGGSAVAAALDFPYGVAVDAQGDVVFADAVNQRIRVLAEGATNPGYALAGCAGTCTWAAGNIYTVAGNGNSSYSGDGGKATSASLHFPVDVSIDSQGDVWIADYGNARVRLIVTKPFNVPPNIRPVATQVTAGQDAVWNVFIQNGTGSNITGISATLHATANGTTPLTFNESKMTGCAAGAGNSEVCGLPDIAAHSFQQFRVFVPTDTLNPGDTVAGDIDVSATAQPDTAGALGTVAIISCGSQCTAGVVAPGIPLASPAPTPAAPTQQLVTLPADQTGADLGPPLAATLQSITPSPGESPSDQKLCPTAANQTHCLGQISSVIAQFAHYNDPANPIRVTITAFWGSTQPTGRILMEKPTGGDPLFLLACQQNATTHRYNTPCVQAQTVTGSTGTGDLTTQNTVLFTALDIHFARRTSTGGTVINPPGAPTAVFAKPGSTTAAVSWKAPTATNGAGVTSYKVTVLSGSAVVKTVTYSSPALTQTITGLTNGKSYTFKVAAGNVAGVGAASTPSAAIVDGAPAAPAKPTAVKVASRSIRVTFTAPVNNGSAITGFIVTCTSTNGGVAGTKTGTVSPQTVTNLTAGKSYTCTVKAKNARGTGPPSPASSAVTA